MALMINIEDAMKVIRDYIRNDENAFKAIEICQDDFFDGLECELEQKSMIFKDEAHEIRIMSLAGIMEMLTVQNIARRIESGDLEPWIKSFHDEMLGYLNLIANHAETFEKRREKKR